MTISYRTGPETADVVLQGALDRRQPSLSLRGITATRSAQATPMAVPYFHLGLEALDHPDPLLQAQHSGWRYSLDADGGPTMAKLGQDADDRPPEFQGISGGLLAERYRAALALAEARLGPPAEVYEPRLLDVPALSYVALWLSGAQDWFIPLLDGHPPGDGPLGIASDILAQLRDRARERRRQVTVRGSNPTPTN